MPKVSCKHDQQVFTHQDVELLPPLCEVDLAFEVVGISDVDKRQILQDQTDIGNARGPREKVV